jgi:CBS domain-containing protein
MAQRGALGRADRALTALFGTSWRVAKIFGIDVRVDSSWVVIAVLITYSMYLRFSFLYKGLSTGAALGIAILAAVLFFGSVLVHELAHALVSLRKVRRVPSDQWPTSRVRDYMVPLGGQILVPPEAPMDQVMAKLEDGEAGRVLAAEGGEVVGIITASDLARWLRRWRTLDRRALDGRAR